MSVMSEGEDRLGIEAMFYFLLFTVCIPGILCAFEGARLMHLLPWMTPLHPCRHAMRRAVGISKTYISIRHTAHRKQSRVKTSTASHLHATVTVSIKHLKRRRIPNITV